MKKYNFARDEQFIHKRNAFEGVKKLNNFKT